MMFLTNNSTKGQPRQNRNKRRDNQFNHGPSRVLVYHGLIASIDRDRSTHASFPLRIYVTFDWCFESNATDIRVRVALETRRNARERAFAHKYCSNICGSIYINASSIIIIALCEIHVRERIEAYGSEIRVSEMFFV